MKKWFRTLLTLGKPPNDNVRVPATKRAPMRGLLVWNALSQGPYVVYVEPEFLGVRTLDGLRFEHTFVDEVEDVPTRLF